MKNQEKLVELLKNETFCDSLFGADTLEEAMALLNAEGVSLSEKEMKDLVTGLAAQKKDDVIGENELESVSGGVIVDTIGTVLLLGGIVAGGYKIGTKATKAVKKWFNS